ISGAWSLSPSAPPNTGAQVRANPSAFRARNKANSIAPRRSRRRLDGCAAAGAGSLAEIAREDGHDGTLSRRVAAGRDPRRPRRRPHLPRAPRELSRGHRPDRLAQARRDAGRRGGACVSAAAAPAPQIAIADVSHIYRPPRGREVLALDGVS